MVKHETGQTGAGGAEEPALHRARRRVCRAPRPLLGRNMPLPPSAPLADLHPSPDLTAGLPALRPLLGRVSVISLNDLHLSRYLRPSRELHPFPYLHSSSDLCTHPQICTLPRSPTALSPPRISDFLGAPCRQKSTCLTLLTSGPDVVQLWLCYPVNL